MSLGVHINVGAVCIEMHGIKEPDSYQIGNTFHILVMASGYLSFVDLNQYVCQYFNKIKLVLGYRKFPAFTSIVSRYK